MKSNVDLTENRDFRSSPAYESVIRKLVRYNPMPIKMEPTETKFAKPSKFYTGYAEDRIAKAMADSFGQADNICDCCGETIPWRFFNDSLCEICRKSFDMEQHSWR